MLWELIIAGWIIISLCWLLVKWIKFKRKYNGSDTGE